jgi:hypothetical protein
MGLDTHLLNTQFDVMLSNNVFEPFTEQSISPCTLDAQASLPLGDFTWMDSADFPTELCANDEFAFPQTFMPSLFGTQATLNQPSDIFLPVEIDLGPSPQPSAIGYGRSPVPELQHYRKFMRYPKSRFD